MVYVDSLVEWSGPYRGDGASQAKRVGARNGHQWCHLLADEADCDELHDFARRIGLRREWFQRNHYDLTPARRARAVALGARELDRHGVVALLRRHRSGAR